VTTAEPSAAQRAAIERYDAVLVVAERSGELQRWLRDGRATAAVVRPDGTVLASGRDVSRLCDALASSAAAALAA